LQIIGRLVGAMCLSMAVLLRRFRGVGVRIWEFLWFGLGEWKEEVGS
jgi:hypothetical protein